MKFIKITIVMLLLLTLTVFAGTAVGALEVNSDEELINALRDKNTETIDINYRNANLYEFVTVDRNLKINGNGAMLTANNGACLTFIQGTSLVIDDLVLCGENDFAIKSHGSVELSGTVEFAEGYGLLLNSGAALNSNAVLVSRTENRIAIGANTNGGEITVSNINISDTTTSGALFYIYRGSGTLKFSGSNSFKSSYGSAVIAATGNESQQKIVISSYASVTAEAMNAKDKDGYGAAFNIRECTLEMMKGAQLTAKGSYGAVYCDSLKTDEECTITAENTAHSSGSGAVTVFGRVAANPTISVGNKNKLSVSGYNGLLVFGCNNTVIGSSSVITSQIKSGDTLCSVGGAVTLGDSVTLNSFSDGRGISAKSSFTCGTDCDITLAPLNSRSKRGIESGAQIIIGGYSVVKCKSADIAIDANEAVTLEDYATIDCEKVGTGVATMRGVITGKGCMISIKEASLRGVYATGTLLADAVSFGEQNTINITGGGTALYSGEAVIFNSGCTSSLECTGESPVIWVNTALNAQGYLRITGSTVNVSCDLSAAGGNAAVNIVGSIIVEDSGKLSVESGKGFGILCRAGDLIVGTRGTAESVGGCAVFVEDGNVRISQGGAIYAQGTLDSGIRVSNGMLRVGENSTIITEGARFGTEILISGGIWLENPKLFDMRSVNSSAIYIENGVFNTANLTTLSAWYPSNTLSNRETWWNTDTSGMKAWEINSKLSEDKLGYADYTRHTVNGTANFTKGTVVSSEGFEANISTFRPEEATRISAHKTRPISSSNYLFIPSGRSFSWQLEAISVEGEGEKFALMSKPNSGTLTLSEGGLLSYSASESTRGEQVFSYTVTAIDGAQSLPVEVVINVTRSKPPAAYNHTFDVQANGSLYTTVSVTDFDGAIASLNVTKQPEHGTVTLGSDGAMMYTPEGMYTGLDSFCYVATDNDGDSSNEATVTLLIGIKGETTAENSTYIAAKNEETSGVFRCSPGREQTFDKIVVTTFPQYGQLIVDGLNFLYIPPENFAGTETFGYTAYMASGIISNEAFISIITVPSEKPRADSLKIDCASGKSYSGKLSAQDLDGKISTFMIESYPQHGEFDFDASNGKFTYVADSGYTGADSFTFYVYDDEGLKSEPAVVNISVDTYMNMLKASGELTKIIIIGVLAVATVIVLIVIIVTGTVRKRRKLDREYEQQYGQGPYDGYYNY